MPLEFATRAWGVDGQGRVVAVQGPADLYTAAELRETLCAEAELGRGRLIVDATDVTILDSSGLSALLAAHRRAARFGSELILVHDDPQIGRTLAVTGLETIFVIAATVDEAIARLRDASTRSSRP